MAVLIGTAVVLLGLFILLSLKISSTSFAPLYTNLDTRDSSSIIRTLESQGVPYELRNNGAEIIVPSDKVLMLRMELAQNGLPSQGSIVGFEIFDKSDTLGTSNFVYNVNYKRALEGELSRTIGAFDDIEKARVHLVIPKRELFSKDKNEPTASVVLELKRKASIGKAEIGAISHLVATAVPNLKVNNITIVDTQGRPFKLGATDENDPTMYASDSQDFKISLERRMREEIEELVSRSVGPGKVQVKVSADVNFDRLVSNSEIFDPDGQVVRSTQTVEEKESAQDKDNQNNVTVANNLPNGQSQNAGASSASNSQRTDETVNYEISKRTENRIYESGNIKKLSIAVLVDGNYAVDGETDKVTYTPRTEDELKQLRTLVSSAVGYDEKRGDSLEVINMQFSRDLAELAPEKPFDWLKDEFHNILQTLVVAVVVILVILLVIKPMVGRAFELTKGDEEVDEVGFEAALAGGQGMANARGDGGQDLIDIERVDERVKAESLKSINELVNEHPEEALSILRNWMNKDTM